MIDLVGADVLLDLQGFFKEMEKVQDIEYYDGPLLTEMRAGAETYLRYWVDCDDSSHRWMLIRVPRKMVEQLAASRIPWDRVIVRGSRDPFVYFVDTGMVGEIVRILKVDLPHVPSEYTPEKDAY